MRVAVHVNSAYSSKLMESLITHEAGFVAPLREEEERGESGKKEEGSMQPSLKEKGGTLLQLCVAPPFFFAYCLFLITGEHANATDECLGSRRKRRAFMSPYL